MKQQNRHEILINAGWGFDPATNRYTVPNAATDGTATQHDIDAAWLHYSTDTAEKTPKFGSPQEEKQQRQADPRRREPE